MTSRDLKFLLVSVSLIVIMIVIALRINFLDFLTFISTMWWASILYHFAMGVNPFKIIKRERSRPGSRLFTYYLSKNVDSFMIIISIITGMIFFLNNLF